MVELRLNFLDHKAKEPDELINFTNFVSQTNLIEKCSLNLFIIHATFFSYFFVYDYLFDISPITKQIITYKKYQS